MGHLPWFRRYSAQYPSRKNVKESLRTASLYDALARLHERLAEMGLIWSDESKSLEQLPPKANTVLSEEGAYYQALDEVS